MSRVVFIHHLTPRERRKVALLASWFFLTIAVLWLLKSFRTASLLTHLGASELPYVRFGSVFAVAIVVALYSRLVDRFSRLDIVRGASILFAGTLLLFWGALRLFGAELGAERWFVWAVFLMVDIYSTVMVGIFWTYTNDVCSRDEADRLYGPIGLGGIAGGIFGGALVDSIVALVGPVELLLLSAALCVVCGGLAWWTEHALRPAARAARPAREGGLAKMLGGARVVFGSRYLLLLVGIVVAYEFASATTDFAINVIFQRSFDTEVELAQMSGRLGWVVSGTAMLSQIVLVPLILPRKRLALLLPPLMMVLPTLALAMFPLVAIAFLLGAADRGMNYSVQQATKETLYVPLGDVQKYKAKAFIDMLVDRGGKAISSVVLMVIIAAQGVSLPIALGVAIGAMMVWIACAFGLGRSYERGEEFEPGAASCRG